MHKRIILTALLMVSGTVFGQQPCPRPCNLVRNSDFSQGNQFWTSDPQSKLTAKGVVTSLASLVSGWPSIGDHTTGSGNFLAIDGSNSTDNVVVWQSNVSPSCLPNVTGTQYTISFWAVNVYPHIVVAGGLTHPQQVTDFDLGIFINNVQVTTVSINSTTWKHYLVSYAGATPSSIALKQLTQGLFRDFGIDDISLVYCPAPVVDCHCPKGWLSNDYTGIGTVNVDGGKTNRLYSACKKPVCGPLGIKPNPTNSTPIGTWGFTWEDAIWAYGTTANGGAAICDTVKCASCYPYKP